MKSANGCFAGGRDGHRGRTLIPPFSRRSCFWSIGSTFCHLWGRGRHDWHCYLIKLRPKQGPPVKAKLILVARGRHIHAVADHVDEDDIGKRRIE
jgi:hypothetical protein